MSWHFKNWAVRKEKICLLLMIFLDLKETYFGLCLFLTSKKFSVEWYFDLGAHDRREII